MIAYFILVHRYPNQFKRLFHAIYDSKDHYLVHVDKRADKSIKTDVKNFISSFPNAHLLKSQDVVWGGYSMVDVELNGIKKLLAISDKWDAYINLSGQDFPIKTNSEIKKFLKKNKGVDFMRTANQAIERPNTMNRIENYFVESTNGFIGTPYKRPYLPYVAPYIGGQWKILSRECCEFICTSPQVNRFKKYYRHTLIADESFFQTVLMNTNYPKKITNDDMRAIVWIPDIEKKLKFKNFTANKTKELVDSGKIKLRPKTFTTKDYRFLIASESLFARKFDETVDSKIFDLIETHLRLTMPKPAKKKIITRYIKSEPILHPVLVLPMS